ncbi:mechanosensitive ion channel family protein [Planctomycetota bacterium]
MDQAIQILKEYYLDPLWHIVIILGGAFVLAILVSVVFKSMFLAISKRTKTEMDDALAGALHWPVVFTIILVGVYWVLLEYLSAPAGFIPLAIIKTIAVIVWGKSAMTVGNILLDGISRQVDRITWIQPKTLPLFDMVLQVLVIGGSIYLAFVAWNINVTSWVASAGVVGIAVGFAAKDTLANLFAGVFILADTPYKIGDFIILDNGLRGIVTDIGIRSTRILTRDDIEVTIPNAVIANAKIVNETSGPHQKMRVRVKVSVAYGSDVDQVRDILTACPQDVENVTPNPAPRVRFRSFGDSGLEFELLAWITKPVYRGRVLDALNTKVYKAFNEAGIEIPYPKRDVYIKEQPTDSK